MNIDASGMDYAQLNELVRTSKSECSINGCLGQRFIGAGLSEQKIRISGIPGNALGAYLDGAEIEVMGSAQDAVGDTMNAGRIIIHGNIGDTAGYAMRGGEIFVQGNAGYRAGIHMKAYRDKLPAIVIGGRAGSFLGEYQAGGVIVVLGMNSDGKRIVGNFPCTGMHGGKMFLRSSCSDIVFPRQVTAHIAAASELEEAEKYVRSFCELFGYDAVKMLDAPFTVITPDSKNPYKQMYVAN